ncbi:MAG: hypothetical protein ACI4R9_02310 [Kiritimatiellia bacterium]
MVAGRRFDLEAARAEARAAKKAARIKAIVSNAVLGLVLLGLAGSGWYGWNRWQDYQAVKAAEAERARQAEEKAEAERARRESERRAAERAKLEAARKAEADRRAAVEAQRVAEAKAREEAAAREREARAEAERLAKENEEWQRANKRHVDKAVGALKFSTFDRVCNEAGTDPCIDLEVDERRWAEMAQCVLGNRPIELLDMVRDDTITNDFSEVHYPDRATLKQLLANLDKERFTMIVRLKTEALNGRRLVLVAADPQEGLVLPQGARTLKDNTGRTTGWTAPFAFGDAYPLFIMSPATLERCNREWRSLKSRIRKEAAKLDNADEYVANRLDKELKDFVRSVRIELQTPPQETKPKAVETRPEPKIKSGLRGSNSEMRRMMGPKSRR